MAALWDIRVVPEYQRNAVGRALIEAASGWSRRQGCRWLKIETQNVNVAACRFYAAMGAKLSGIDQFAYADLPDAVELDWVLELWRSAASPEHGDHPVSQHGVGLV